MAASHANIAACLVHCWVVGQGSFCCHGLVDGQLCKPLVGCHRRVSHCYALHDLHILPSLPSRLA